MDKLIDDLIKLAFAEDIGDGDHTTLCCIPETAMGKSQLIIKEDGVLAGVEMAKRIFHDFDPELKMTVFIQDGAEVKKGDIAFVVEGKIQSLLQTERLMLNVMQRMSGIATTTRKYAKALEGTKTHVLDTRKTTPGMRMIEKEAVRIGGGMNHRIGLFDMILLKDNHVDFAGGIEQAITRAQNYLKEKGKRIIGWTEILEGGLVPDATLMSWSGERGGIEKGKLSLACTSSYRAIGFGRDSCSITRNQWTDKCVKWLFGGYQRPK